MNAQTATVDRMLAPPAVMEKTSLSRTTLWRLVKRREFPAPAKLSPGRVGWSANAVEDWLSEKREAAA